MFFQTKKPKSVVDIVVDTVTKGDTRTTTTVTDWGKVFTALGAVAGSVGAAAVVVGAKAAAAEEQASRAEAEAAHDHERRR